MGPKVRSTWERFADSADPANGSSDFGSVGVSKGSWFSHRDTFAFGQRGGPKRSGAFGWTGKFFAGLYESHTSGRVVPNVSGGDDRQYLFR